MQTVSLPLSFRSLAEKACVLRKSLARVRRTGVVLTGLVLAGPALMACSSDNAPQRFPGVPVQDVLDSAGHPAFRTMDHDSFRYAVVKYPADDGFHRVPIGDYLAVRLAETFPRNAEVSKLRLLEYDVVCDSEGWISSDVVCVLEGEFSFRLYNRPYRVSVPRLRLDLGGQEDVETAEFRVREDREENAFTRQIRKIVDVTAAEFEKGTKPVLVESNSRQMF